MNQKQLVIAMGLCLSVGLIGCSDSSSNGDDDPENGTNGGSNGDELSAGLDEGAAPWLMYTIDLTDETKSDAPDLKSGLWAVSAEQPQARGAVDPDADLEGPFISLYTETVSGGTASDFSVDRVLYLQKNGRWATVDTQADAEELSPRWVSSVQGVDLEDNDDYIVQWDTEDADNAYVAWRESQSDPYRAVSLSMDGSTSAHELETGLKTDESIRKLLTGVENAAGVPDGWLAFTDKNRLVKISLDGDSVDELQDPVFDADTLGVASESGRVLVMTTPDEDLTELPPYQLNVYQPDSAELVDVTLGEGDEALRLQTPEFEFEGEDNEPVELKFSAPVSEALTQGDKWQFLVTYPIEQLDDEQFSDAKLRQFTVMDNGSVYVQESDRYLASLDPISDFNEANVGPEAGTIVNSSDRIIYRAKVTHEQPKEFEEDFNENYLMEFITQDNRDIENCAISFPAASGSDDATALIDEDNTENCFRVASLGDLSASGEGGAIFWENFAAGNDSGEPVKMLNVEDETDSVLYPAQWLGGGVAKETGNAVVDPNKRALEYVLISGREDSQEVRLINAVSPETDVSATRLLGAIQELDIEGLPSSSQNKASLKGSNSGRYRLLLLESDSSTVTPRHHIAWIDVQEEDSLTPLNPIITISGLDLEEQRHQGKLTRPLDHF